jgi:hypothetical protein
MPIASIEVWRHAEFGRRCEVLVYENACELQVYSHGEPVISRLCESLGEAIEQAYHFRPDIAEPKAA